MADSTKGKPVSGNGSRPSPIRLNSWRLQAVIRYKMPVRSWSKRIRRFQR